MRRSGKERMRRVSGLYTTNERRGQSGCRCAIMSTLLFARPLALLRPSSSARLTSSTPKPRGDLIRDPKLRPPPEQRHPVRPARPHYQPERYPEAPRSPRRPLPGHRASASATIPRRRFTSPGAGRDPHRKLILTLAHRNVCRPAGRVFRCRESLSSSSLSVLRRLRVGADVCLLRRPDPPVHARIRAGLPTQAEAQVGMGAGVGCGAGHAGGCGGSGPETFGSRARCGRLSGGSSGGHSALRPEPGPAGVSVL